VRVFYIMLVTAAIAVVVVLAAVIASGWSDADGRASRNTTSAVAGALANCDNLTGAEKERCLERRQAGAASSARGPVRETKPGGATDVRR
jgi:hypothetical protein